MSTLNSAFQHLFGRLTSDMAPHDQVRLILNSHQLDKSISLPFLQRDRLMPERFLAAVERVVQSNDQFTLDDSVSVNVIHVEMPQGGTGRKRDVVNLESFLRKKDCIVQIKNKDELCCARAIVVPKAKLDKDPKYKSIVDHRGKVRELHETAGVPLGSCGIAEVTKFQAALPGHQLNVISKEHLNAMINSGPEADKCYTCTTTTINTMSLPACQPFSPVSSIVISARKASTKSPVTRVAICASCVIPRTVPLLNGNFAKTVTVSLRAMNASTAIKMTPVLPNPCAVLW